MGLIVTQEHLDMARNAGACSEGLRVKVGTPLHKIPAEYLAWIETALPEFAKTVAAEASSQCCAIVRGVAALATFGSGYGDGYGSGYGSGYGDGDGYGSGSGDGSGYGYGSGSGYLAQDGTC